MAICLIKTKDYKQTIEHCNKALEIDSNNLKALFRRGIAYSEIDDWDLGQKDFEKALEFDPNNKEVKKEFDKLKKKIREQNKKDGKIFGGMFEKLAKEEELERKKEELERKKEEERKKNEEKKMEENKENKKSDANEQQTETKEENKNEEKKSESKTASKAEDPMETS